LDKVSTIDTIGSRLDLTQILCDLNDYSQQFEQLWEQQPQLPSMPAQKKSPKRMHLSKIITNRKSL
jgi:hypothetical protein